MTNKGKKMEPPLKLDMSFSEALGRFVRTSPQEVDESIERSKTKKPPQDAPPRRPSLKEERTALPGRNRKPDKA